MNALREEHIRAIHKGSSRASQTSQNQNQTSGRAMCNRCGKKSHQMSECTNPSSVKCNKCKKLGHIKPECRGVQPPQQKQSNSRPTNQRCACEIDDFLLLFVVFVKGSGLYGDQLGIGPLEELTLCMNLCERFWHGLACGHAGGIGVELCFLLHAGGVCVRPLPMHMKQSLHAGKIQGRRAVNGLGEIRHVKVIHL